MSGTSEKGFLVRWADRKAKAQKDQTQKELMQEPLVPEEPTAGADAVLQPGETDKQLLDRLGLPEPETLQAGDDFRTLLRAPLTAALKRRTLRRLWTVNPDLANLDGLLDYGEDYTDKATVVENLKTAWAAGKGYSEKLKHTDPNADEMQAIDNPSTLVGPELTGPELTEPELTGPNAIGTDALSEDRGVPRQKAGLSSERPEQGDEVSEDPETWYPARRMQFRFGET